MSKSINNKNAHNPIPTCPRPWALGGQLVRTTKVPNVVCDLIKRRISA